MRKQCGKCFLKGKGWELAILKGKLGLENLGGDENWLKLFFSLLFQVYFLIFSVEFSLKLWKEVYGLWATLPSSRKESGVFAPFFKKFFQIYLFLLVWILCLHVCMCIPYVPGDWEGQKRESEIPWNWSCECSWATMLVLQSFLGTLQEEEVVLTSDPCLITFPRGEYKKKIPYLLLVDPRSK